jgi:hypothetical protein
LTTTPYGGHRSEAGGEPFERRLAAVERCACSMERRYGGPAKMLGDSDQMFRIQPSRRRHIVGNTAAPGPTATIDLEQRRTAMRSPRRTGGKAAAAFPGCRSHQARVSPRCGALDSQVGQVGDDRGLTPASFDDGRGLRQ